jgi:cell division protein FtsL
MGPVFAKVMLTLVVTGLVINVTVIHLMTRILEVRKARRRVF